MVGLKWEKTFERVAVWLLALWLAFLAGVQFEKWNARREARILHRIEEGR